MFINKIGQNHLEYGMNCQDAGYYRMGNTNIAPPVMFAKVLSVKCVCDGCSEGKHSEIGAGLYTLLSENSTNYNIEKDMDELVTVLSHDVQLTPSTIKNYLCFTVFVVLELDFGEDMDNSFSVDYCGDGYIILQDLEDNITFKKIDNGEYPEYLAYNYIEDKDRLNYYKEGVHPKHESFSKRKYKNVGVATDGIRYIIDHEDEELKNEFINILKSGKDTKMKIFINKHQSIFKDDVTIAF